jgi:hypothetical protein
MNPHLSLSVLDVDCIVDRMRSGSICKSSYGDWPALVLTTIEHLTQ